MKSEFSWDERQSKLVIHVDEDKDGVTTKIKHEYSKDKANELLKNMKSQRDNMTAWVNNIEKSKAFMQDKTNEKFMSDLKLASEALKFENDKRTKDQYTEAVLNLKRIEDDIKAIEKVIKT